MSILPDSSCSRNNPRRTRIPRASAVPGRPGEQLVDRPGVDDPLGRHAALLGPLAAVGLPVELAGRVRVGVDREQAAGLDRQPQQPPRRVAAAPAGS